jgi:hypothetical protein
MQNQDNHILQNRSGSQFPPPPQEKRKEKKPPDKRRKERDERDSAMQLMCPCAFLSLIQHQISSQTLLYDVIQLLFL